MTYSTFQKIKFPFIFSLFIFGFLSCSKDEIKEPDITEIPDDVETQIKDFVWKSMNSWYLYEAETPALEDEKHEDIPTYVDFLESYSSPEALFDGLIYKKDIKDRFSFIVDDYNELENMLQGISESFGYDFQLVRTSASDDNLLGYVRYVIPDSPADKAGIKRGDLFNKINGQQLTAQNYQQLLFNQRSYTLGLVVLKNNQFVSGESIDMDAVTIHENPIHLAQIIEISGGKKVGYLVYNEFNYLYHQELNHVFSQFKDTGVDEMVLDLRYNPGGSVLTAALLASMLYTTDTEKRFIKYQFNDKQSEESTALEFFDQVPVLNEDYQIVDIEPLHSLELSKLYVLTSSGTASASEAIINGLKPYLDVVIIGERTVGKNVGSRTLYDSPSTDFTDKSKANPAHKYALQPLTTKIVNSTGFGDFENGFAPDIKISELDYLLEMKPMGDLEEPLLHAALEMMLPVRSGDVVLPAKYTEMTFLPGPERKSQNRHYQILNLDMPE